MCFWRVEGRLEEEEKVERNGEVSIMSVVAPALGCCSNRYYMERASPWKAPAAALQSFSLFPSFSRSPLARSGAAHRLADDLSKCAPRRSPAGRGLRELKLNRGGQGYPECLDDPCPPRCRSYVREPQPTGACPVPNPVC